MQTSIYNTSPGRRELEELLEDVKPRWTLSDHLFARSFEKPAGISR